VVFGQKSELPSEARALPNYRELWANEPFSKYDPATEMVEKRDQVSKHFRNADGTFSAHIAGGPINYQENGEWKSIFKSIDINPQGGFKNEHNKFKSYYPESLNQEFRTILPTGDPLVEMQSLKMYFESNSTSVGQKISSDVVGILNDNKLLYPGAFGAGIDVELIQTNIGKKLNYVIKDKNAISSLDLAEFLVFEETVILPQNYIAQLRDGAIYIIDGSGQTVFVYSKPSVLEGESSEEHDEHEDKELPGQPSNIIKYDFIQNGNELIVKTYVSYSWLLSDERVFPLYVDPTNNYYPDNITMWTGHVRTYTTTEANAYSTSDNATKYSNTDYYTVYGQDKYFSTYYGFHPWFRFNTSSLENTATVSAVSFSGYFFSRNYDGSTCSVTTEFNPLISNPVSALAADLLTDIRNGTAYATYTFTNANSGSNAYKTFNFSSSANTDLQNLLSSDWFGFGLEHTSTNDKDDYGYVGGHDDGASYLPYISVTYTTITVPTVTTTTASSIGNFTASSGGNVTGDGGASVTARGVQWSTSPLSAMPSGSTSSDGTGTGSFTSSLTGLSASTVYYYRAYALNSVGYGYGAEQSFVTDGPSAEGYYISGNIENNGTIISTSDVNYLRMTGGTSDATKKTITGNGTFTDSKLFVDGYIEYQGLHTGKFNETFVNASKTLVIQTGKTYPNGTMSNYGTLTLNGTGIITNTGSVINGGTLTVASTGEITVGGSWTNNSTFTPGSGQVTFDGSSNSIIGGSSAISFYKLKMNKSASGVTTTLAANATVTNTLTLTMGNLVTSSYTAYVSNSTSASVSGGSSNSYVKGNLKRAVAGENTYVFPVGQSLYEEASLAFSTGYTSADITAFFTDASPGSLPAGGLTQSGTNLVGILDKGYWSIDPSAGAVGSPTYTVTLKETGHANGTTNAANYTVIKRTNSPSVGAWEIQGTHSNTTQTDAGGIVTAVRSGLTSFSDFAIGFGGGALPIELISFQANCSDNNTVDVTWSTASEHNTNYFRVDKSRDGSKWDVLNTIGAAGNSNNVIDYALTDAFPNPGINYYRLTQYDNDGVFETFDAQAAVCKDQQSGTALSTYPNPSSGDFNVDLQTDELEGEATLLITDAKGAVIHSQDIKIIKGTNNYVIQRFEAEPGIYYISVKAGASTVTTKHSLR